jgi:hypothetical protein
MLFHNQSNHTAWQQHKESCPNEKRIIPPNAAKKIQANPSCRQIKPMCTLKP